MMTCRKALQRFRWRSPGVCAFSAASREGAGRPAETAMKDAWITTQVQAKYFVVDREGTQHRCRHRSGVVTLTGEVTGAAERQRAVAQAKEVDGAVAFA